MGSVKIGCGVLPGVARVLVVPPAVKQVAHHCAYSSNSDYPTSHHTIASTAPPSHYTHLAKATDEDSSVSRWDSVGAVALSCHVSVRAGAEDARRGTVIHTAAVRAGVGACAGTTKGLAPP